jgi:hypothetical protein
VGQLCRVQCGPTLAAAALSTASASAEPTSLTQDSVEGIFGEGLSGRGQADSKTGAMTWSYPFDLLAARGRPQPRLSLNYHSSSRDREAGYGWGFDLPVIEQKPLSGRPCFTQAGVPIQCGAPEANAPSAERYVYSGQPLVPICLLPEAPVAPPGESPDLWIVDRFSGDGGSCRCALARRRWLPRAAITVHRHMGQP